MNFLSNLFGQQNSTPSQPGQQGFGNYQGAQQSQMSQLNFGGSTTLISGGLGQYSYGTSIFDIDAKIKEVSNDHTEQTKKKEIVDNLSPETKEVIKLMGTIRTSTDVKDLLIIDKYIKGLLFKNKLEQIID